MRAWVLAVMVGVGVGARAQTVDKPFDPSRDPVRDLRAAEARAASEHKNILMDVGGNWCPWCLLLERTFAGDAGLQAELDKNYVLLRVNWSPEAQNAEFLVKFPEPHGYPAWYVLSPTGKVLKVEDTSELEKNHRVGGGYNKAAIEGFLEKYAPGK